MFEASGVMGGDVILPLRPGQASVVCTHEKETGREAWLVSATIDGGELIIGDYASEQEAIAAAVEWRNGL
jgi:hypothetical protein